MDQRREVAGGQIQLRGVVADIPICVESPVQGDEEVLENLILAGLFLRLYLLSAVGDVGVDDFVAKGLHESRYDLFAQMRTDLFPVADSLDQSFDAPILYRSQGDERMETDVDMALGVGNRVERGENEIEIGLPDHSLQVVAEVPDVSLRKGGIDIQIAFSHVIGMVVHHQGYIPLFAQQESVLLQTDGRTLFFASRQVMSMISTSETSIVFIAGIFVCKVNKNRQKNTWLIVHNI